MEPKIPDNSICLFNGGEALAGSRNGRIVLVRLRDGIDPDTSGRLTVKRYHSEKLLDEDGSFLHLRITLHPLNREFEPIQLDPSEEEAFKVLGEFVAVIAPMVD